MKKHQKIKILFFLFLPILFVISCSDSDDEGKYDPSKPIVVNDFSPKEGFTRTGIYITGSNFGTDVSLIHVNIGDKEAPVIGSDGNTIYCLTPRRITGSNVKLTIENKNGETLIEHNFVDTFAYIARTSVTTYAGKVDELGKSSMIDGPIEEAEFDDPFWLEFEQIGDQKMLYVCEHGKAIRRIDINKGEVATLMTNGQGAFRAMQTISFTSDRDTMYITDDNGQSNRNMMTLSYALRSENYRKAYHHIYDRTSYSSVVHPKDGTLFYNTYFNGGVMKAFGQYDSQTGKWDSKHMFNINDNAGMQTKMVMHPEGKYVYLMAWHCVLKSFYDEKTKELQHPTVFVGGFDQPQYLDAPGTQARFNYTHQGVFVKNPQYVIEGRDDVYDFYLCDVDNHCIRKITPEGFVSTYAGRGSIGLDNQPYGFVDGEIRIEARFQRPSGIAYDEEDGLLYVAERGYFGWGANPQTGNRRIRVITIE